MIAMNNLHELVSQARERRGFRTQGDLAAVIGRDVSYVSRLERGLLKEIPQPEMMDALARALGVTVADLLHAAGYDVKLPEPSEVITVRRDDPRADLLAMLDGETDEGVRRAADLINAIRMYSRAGNNTKHDVSSDRKKPSTESDSPPARRISS